MWVDASALQYLPIVILLALGAAVGIGMLGINVLLGERDTIKNSQKIDVYECGVPSVGSARQQFSVRYYVVGMIFLLFDVETIFLYPWAVVYKQYLSHGAFMLWELLLFCLLLGIGYIYVVRRKGLEWD